MVWWLKRHSVILCHDDTDFSIPWVSLIVGVFQLTGGLHACLIHPKTGAETQRSVASARVLEEWTERMGGCKRWVCVGSGL